MRLIEPYFTQCLNSKWNVHRWQLVFNKTLQRMSDKREHTAVELVRSIRTVIATITA